MHDPVDRDIVVQASEIARAYRHGRTIVPAVRHASCEIRRGDLIGLMGRSGSGKSTLLHLLGALDQPDAGTITWPIVPTGASPRPAFITDVFQGPSLLPELNVLDNVRLPLILAGVEAGQARVDALSMLARFGMDAFAGKQPEELSGGQAQRVGIARALVGKPALILADEPTGQLDRETAARTMTTLIESASSFGAALVVATHDPHVAARFPIRWLMNDGMLDPGDDVHSRDAGGARSPSATLVKDRSS
jgi:putative ABC transport system ATP-binding protein